MRKAVVVGSGPNGLSAAIVLAKAGIDTTLIEAQPNPGGGVRSEALTLPGFVHDVCSAVHPLAISSPFFRALPLKEHGLEWIQPPAALAHPLDDGAVLLENELDAAERALGEDGPRYRRAVEPLVRAWDDLAEEVLAPLHWPRRPALFARFGALAGLPAGVGARIIFRTREGRALFAGLAGHSVLPLSMLGTSAIAWILAAAAHHGGWPIPKGGSQAIANALLSYYRSLGGRVELGRTVASLDELGGADTVLLDLTPRQVEKVAGNRLPGWYRAKLAGYRYGPGVFKMDWALSSPIPWRSDACARAATVHVGGTLQEIEQSERSAWRGECAQLPFVLVAQPSLFDASRAPEDRHTAWAYCHVPNGSTTDMSERIESQIERFAPGFRATILARHAMNPADLERRNANLVGGDITGGAQDVLQLFLRPTSRFYRTPARGVYICSASTPPGGGVHGMCGFWAAQAALEDARRR